MKTIYFIIFFMSVSCIFSANLPDIPETIDEIKISLRSESDINNALYVIKQSNPQIYDNLKILKDKNSTEFLPKLEREYFTWMHTEVMKKKRHIKEKGYRIKVKESDASLKKLKEDYIKAASKDKDIILNKIKEEAEKRFIIEFDYLNKQLEQSKDFVKHLELKAENFQKNKSDFINRLTNKNLQNKAK